jgi:hypothetical protein
MITFSCFAAVLLLVPVAFAVCEIVTLLALDALWRLWALVPLGVVGGIAILLTTKQIANLFGATIFASAGGFVALGFVWAAYHRSARKVDASDDG